MSQSRLSLLTELRSLSWNKEGGWTVTLNEALSGLTAADANRPPHEDGMSVRQVLRHLNFFNEQLLCRLTGRPFELTADSNDATFGQAEDGSDEAGWQAEIARAERVADGLKTTFAGLTEDALDQPFGSSTLGDYLTNWIMHDAYHTGQIVLIRKLLGVWTVKQY